MDELTDPLRTEARLLESERRLRAVLEQGPLAIAVTGPVGEIVSHNAEFDRLWGRPAHDTTARTYSRVYEGYHLDGRPIASEEWPGARALLRGEVIDGEVLEIAHLSGRRIACSFNAGPIRDEEGRITGAVVMFHDVTEKRRLQAALDRQSDAFANSLLESTTDCIKVLDEEGRLLSANTPGLASLDVDDFEAIRGAEYAAFHPGEGAAGVRAAVAEALAGRTGRYFGTAPTAKGRWGWWEVTTTPIATAPGEPRRVLAVTREVTDRHRAQEELRESEARLSFLDRLGAKTAVLSDADEILRTTTRLVGEHMGVSVCAYADMDEDEDGFTIRGEWAALGSTSIMGHYRLADFGALAVKNLSAGLPLVVNDNLRELAPEEAATFQSIGITATICMPLVKEGRLTALMAIHDKVPRVWTEDELGLMREVTARSWAHIERVGAIAELRASEARFQAITNSIDQMVWSTRPDGFHDYYNQRWYDYTGVPEGTTDGEGWNDVFHPEDQDRAWSAWQHSLETGEPYHIEYRLRHRSGQYRWVLGRAQPMRDDAGHITRWYGTCTDIQEIVEAREVLARSREELEELVEARTAERNQLWSLSQDMLARADYQGMMSAVSPAWTRVLGWSEAELLSRSYASFMHPEDMGPTLEALARMGETGASTRFENRIATKDGGWKPIEWTVAAEPDSSNFVAVGRDVSAERERQAELAAAQEQLRQSQKMEAMGQLTGGVAHDFNNLLTPIIGSLDRLVTRGLGSERERRLMAGALESAERAKTLVQRLLAFARRQPLQPVAVDVGTLVEGMAELIGSTLGPSIEVRVELAQDLPPAKADPNQLEMALLNLAVNARDAMPEGGTLTVAASRESVRGRGRAGSGLKQGHYVRLSVEDTGVGMDKATLASAVEPFFSTKGIGRGTGLGLSMVHGLAAQLGGGLTIRSAPGQGTTVELWLPLSAEPIDTKGEEQVAVPPVASRGRALLVDDEDLVRMSTADMLADLGFEVQEAGRAEDALQLLQEGASVDLLVTDHLMPGMSGAELARTVRQLRPGLPVLVVSGYAEVEGLAPDLPRLVKPFRIADLAQSVATLMPGEGIAT